MNVPGNDFGISPVESEKHQMPKYPSQKKQKDTFLFNWKLTLFAFVRAAVTQYHKLVV